MRVGGSSVPPVQKDTFPDRNRSNADKKRSHAKRTSQGSRRNGETSQSGTRREVYTAGAGRDRRIASALFKRESSERPSSSQSPARAEEKNGPPESKSVKNDSATRNADKPLRTMSMVTADIVSEHSSMSTASPEKTTTYDSPCVSSTDALQTSHMYRHVPVAMEYLSGRPSDQQLMQLPGGERLARLLNACDSPILNDEVRESLVDSVYGRRSFRKRQSWSTKVKQHAVAYTAAEVYENLDSVPEELLSYEPEERVLDDALPRMRAMRGVADVSILQSTYNALFPSTVGVDYSADARLVEESDVHMEVGKVTVDSTPDVPDLPRYDLLQPVLQTMISSRRPMTQTETLLGYQKRNANVPRVSSGLLPPQLAKTALQNFLASVVGDVDQFATFEHMPIAINEERFDAWVKVQPNEAVQRYLSKSDVGMDEKMTQYFSYMIKVALKPPVKDSDAATYQAVQTIAFSSKDINAIFSPIFIEMTRRWLGVLKPKYKYYTRLSPDAFEREFNTDFDVGTLFNAERVENDISKYDKSMGAWYLLFETELYRLLGMPEWLVDIWYASHVVSTYAERDSGFSAAVHFQRRSGDASTFFGNTLINHCAAVAIYDDADIDVGVFAGDDAVMFGRGISYDSSGAYADAFNFESKTFTKFVYPYFCGKFLIPAEDGVYFVPDPIKTLTKWGRRDLRNADHVRQYYVSCRDGLAPLDNEYIMSGLCDALTERYGTESGDYEAFVRSMLAFVDDEDAFKRLFYTVKGGRYITDPSLPDVDM